MFALRSKPFESVEKHLLVARNAYLMMCRMTSLCCSDKRKQLYYMCGWRTVTSLTAQHLSWPYPIDGVERERHCLSTGYFKGAMQTTQFTGVSYSLTNPRLLAANPCLSTERCGSLARTAKQSDGLTAE